jgi:F0F1-type ATP synthase membrane subunit a
MFLFIFVSSWSGALLVWKIKEFSHEKLATSTNALNTTVALALLYQQHIFMGHRSSDVPTLQCPDVLSLACGPHV